MNAKLKKYSFITLLLLPPLFAIVSNSHMLAQQSPKEAQKTNPAPFDEVVYNWSRTLAEVLQTTNQKHYKIANAEQCMIKAIDSFLTSLDPHSNFLDPKTYKNILEATSGEFFGIGIVIDNTRQQKDKFLLVNDTIPNGPADNAGVKQGDKIVEIDGKSLEGMSTDEATANLKGERNTVVHIKILRENSPDMLAFDIKRDVIKEQNSICFYLPDQNVYYLSLNMFTENSIKQIKELLEQSRKKQYKALILDLRNNSGGLLTAAIEIAGLFLDKGTEVVVTKDKHNKVIDRYTTLHTAAGNDTLPIFILINNYTASAAEILAGCLKLHSQDASQTKKKAKKLMVFLVGTQTFGKGSVQEVIPMSNNCAMKLTTSLYFLPHDISIQGVGIEPDFEIERKLPPTNQVNWFNKFYGREQALENYINVHGNQENPKENSDSNKEKNWIERAKDILEKDNQFRETLTLINMLYTAKTNCPHEVSDREKAVKFLKGIFVSNTPLKMQEVKI